MHKSDNHSNENSPCGGSSSIIINIQKAGNRRNERAHELWLRPDLYLIEMSAIQVGTHSTLLIGRFQCTFIQQCLNAKFVSNKWMKIQQRPQSKHNKNRVFRRICHVVCTYRWLNNKNHITYTNPFHLFFVMSLTTSSVVSHLSFLYPSSNF